MGLPQRGIENPFDGSTSEVAAVLCRIPGRGNLHAGLFYRAADGRRQAIHLGWQDTLSGDWDWAHVWAAPEADEALLKSVAAKCRLVWSRFQNEKKFPYGLHYAGATFDAGGRLRMSPQAKGLTCATFILAIMESVGIQLIDLAGWPIRQEEDEKFLLFAEEFAERGLLEQLRQEVRAGPHRVHPNEVVAACQFEGPSNYCKLATGSQTILEMV